MPINLFHSVRKLDYGSLLIESVVLMVGVFLALQAENWNEQRKGNIEAKAYHVRLQQDFESMRYQTEKNIKALDLKIVATKGLSGIVQQNLDSESIAKVKEYLGELLYIPTPVSPSATYIEMLGGNKIGLLSDSDLIGKLIKGNALIEGEQSNTEILNQLASMG